MHIQWGQSTDKDMKKAQNQKINKQNEGNIIINKISNR